MRINVDLKKFKVNRVIKYFILVDLVFFGGWGLIGPIFAIFILEQVATANLITIGAVSGIYWIVKSLAQIPVAMYLDKHEGERDDFYALLIGLMLAGFSAMAYLLINSVFSLFVVEVLHAVAFGFYVPSWSAIFSRHLDKKHYAFDWSLDSTAVGLVFGLTAFLGGTMAKFLGFKAVFILVSLLSFASALILFLVPNLIIPKQTSRKPIIRDHTPMNINK